MSVETLLTDDRLVLALAAVLLGVAIASRYLRPRLARRLETVRGLVWRAVDGVARRRGRPLIRDKTGDGEYVTTIETTQHHLETALHGAGWRWNPLSTKKYRRVNGERQWSIGTMVWRDGVLAARQLHCYYFYNSDGGIDVYCHDEPSAIARPRAHVGGADQVAGDPDNRLREGLAAAEIETRNAGS